MSEAWGFGLLLLESDYAVFPMTYAEMVIPVWSLTGFNRAARAQCAEKNIEYTHAVAVEHAITVLAEAILPALDKGEVDRIAVARALGFVSRFSDYRFWIARYRHDGTATIDHLNGATASDAERHSKQLISQYHQMVNREIRVYVAGTPISIAG